MIFVYKPSDNIKKRMINFYSGALKENKPPYSVFQAQNADTTITLYESGKVMFQGLSADIEASLWQDMEKKINNRDISLEDRNKQKDKTKEPEQNRDYLKKYSTAGSDEVGTGDYFGPIVVTASYVDESKIPLMKELGVDDSKKITDDKIKTIAPVLMKEIPYVTYILKNENYNNLKDSNMNKIKAVLHNKVLVSLLEKDGINPKYIVIDQFVYPKKYFEHIKEAPKKVTRIMFMTKAESQVYSVAASSIIARYVFLSQMKSLSQEIGFNIPLGAGTEVDKFGRQIVNIKGPEILNKIAKKNFKNTEKILNQEN
jgi:ribonuclease HIII